MTEPTRLNLLLAVLKDCPEFDLAEFWQKNQIEIKRLSEDDRRALIAEKDRVKAKFAAAWVPIASDDGFTDRWYRGEE